MLGSGVEGSQRRERSSLDAWILGSFRGLFGPSSIVVVSIFDRGLELGKRVSCYSRLPIQLRWEISMSLEVGRNMLNIPRMVAKINDEEKGCVGCDARFSFGC